MIDQPRIAAAVTEILKAIGEDPTREGLRETPRRVAELYTDLFSGLHESPMDILGVGFEETYKGVVLLRDIPFSSLCEHHLLPFHGRAHIAYIPAGTIIGLSKLARVVDLFAHRPQLQERLTAEIADTLVSSLHPEGVAVIVEAEHMCVAMRDVKKSHTSMVTSAMRGVFDSQSSLRLEILALLKQS